MNKIEKGQEIYITPYMDSIPDWFDVTSESDKAIQLQHQITKKSLWLPRKAVAYNDKYRCFHLELWFLRIIENWQLSILQG